MGASTASAGCASVVVVTKAPRCPWLPTPTPRTHACLKTSRDHDLSCTLHAFMHCLCMQQGTAMAGRRTSVRTPAPALSPDSGLPPPAAHALTGRFCKSSYGYLAARKQLSRLLRDYLELPGGGGGEVDVAGRLLLSPPGDPRISVRAKMAQGSGAHRTAESKLTCGTQCHARALGWLVRGCHLPWTRRGRRLVAGPRRGAGCLCQRCRNHALPPCDFGF